MKKVVFLLLLAFLGLPVFAQRFEYKFQLNIPDPASIKPLQENLYALFDAMPRYTDSTNVFQVRSAVNMDQEKLTMKVQDMGYTLIFFSKRDLEIEKKQDDKVD